MLVQTVSTEVSSRAVLVEQGMRHAVSCCGCPCLELLHISEPTELHDCLVCLQGVAKHKQSQNTIKCQPNKKNLDCANPVGLGDDSDEFEDAEDDDGDDEEEDPSYDPLLHATPAAAGRRSSRQSGRHGNGSRAARGSASSEQGVSGRSCF